MHAAAVMLGAAAGGFSAQASAPADAIEAEEHWATKEQVRLYLYRKHARGSGADAPVLFLVHGSTFTGRGSYDLTVAGRAGYSAMQHFAELGYDVWTMDHEGYGFSSRTNSNSGIQSGVADLRAALPVVERVTGKAAVMMFGESSGAIRAAAFALSEPRRVQRLVLHAFTYTGENAPEIERRRQQAAYYRTHARRPFGMEQIQRIFERDVAGSADPLLVKALADYELQFGDSVPSGTYLDMAVNMPMVDPTRLQCPVCLVRPEHDGNASEEELFQFFRALASKDKQFTFMQGMTHAGGMIGRHRYRLWHVMHAFFSCPSASPPL
jgi:alpha-beta hydrolase superfamily lysophospholipase